jgi:hypothetical protein
VPAEPTATRRALGRQLAIARVTAGHTYRSMSNVLGRSHTHVQRIETAKAPISAPEAKAWLDAAAASDDTRDTVLALVAAAAAETVPYRSEQGHLQQDAAERIEAADAVCSFQPHVVPGLLQTESYCRALGVPSNLDLEAHVAARMVRQAVLTSGREFRFVIRRHVLDLADAEQRAKVVSAHGGPVAVRVLADEAGFSLATIGFMIYSVAGIDTAVGMELPHGRHEITDPEHVSVYRTLVDEMFAAAKPVSNWRS